MPVMYLGIPREGGRMGGEHGQELGGGSPMGIWAICRSNIVGRDLQLGRGDSSVPTPEQLWEVVEKGVHWGGGGTASSQLKTGG